MKIPGRLTAWLIPTIIFVLSAGSSFAQSPENRPGSSNAGKIINLEAPGNLEAKNNLGCTGYEGLTNKNTPADLYVAMSKCLKKKDYALAAELYAIAGAYATFDMLRVADQTAHQANTVLTMRATSSVPQEDSKKMIDILKVRLKKGSENLQKECDNIRRVGIPDYYPRYMIAHGMGAFSGKQTNKGLVMNFKPAEAMEEALNKYLHCKKRDF